MSVNQYCAKALSKGSVILLISSVTDLLSVFTKFNTNFTELRTAVLVNFKNSNLTHCLKGYKNGNNFSH